MVDSSRVGRIAEILKSLGGSSYDIGMIGQSVRIRSIELNEPKYGDWDIDFEILDKITSIKKFLESGDNPVLMIKISSLEQPLIYYDTKDDGQVVWRAFNGSSSGFVTINFK